MSKFIYCKSRQCQQPATHGKYCQRHWDRLHAEKPNDVFRNGGNICEDREYDRDLQRDFKENEIDRRRLKSALDWMGWTPTGDDPADMPDDE
jgi:hypothetical protein